MSRLALAALAGLFACNPVTGGTDGELPPV